MDEQLPFKTVRIAVLTVSDTRQLHDDRSGDTLAQRLVDAGHILADRSIVPDDADLIVAQLHRWIDDEQIDCVISTGGTGVTGRDVTPEAFARVWDKETPGFGVLFHCQIGSAPGWQRVCAYGLNSVGAVYLKKKKKS